MLDLWTRTIDIERFMALLETCDFGCSPSHAGTSNT